MVRAKKNLPVKTTPMAAGADYGEVQAALASDCTQHHFIRENAGSDFPGRTTLGDLAQAIA